MKKAHEQGKLIILSAPSGSGKTSIVKYLLEKEPRLEFSVSATSRQQRREEEDGKDYYFLSADEFRHKIANDEFVEWEEVYEDIYYGTLRSELDRIWSLNKHVVFDVDVMGGLKLKNIFGNRAVSIFIQPPGIDELKKRLSRRGTDSPAEIDMRISKAVKEMTKAGYFDIIIVNDELQKARGEALKECKAFIDQGSTILN